MYLCHWWKNPLVNLAASGMGKVLFLSISAANRPGKYWKGLLESLYINFHLLIKGLFEAKAILHDEVHASVYIQKR